MTLLIRTPHHTEDGACPYSFIIEPDGTGLCYFRSTLYNSAAVRITGRPPDGANVMLRRTTRTV